MYQNRSLTRFVLLSALLHILFMTATGLFAPVSDPAPPPTPVKIRIVPPDETPPVDDDPLKGRIEDLPTPAEEVVPEKADILSQGDSVAHSPKEGERYQSNKTAIPRKKTDPAPPAVTQDDRPKERRSPTPQESKVASLEKPTLDLTRKNSAEKLDLFSQEALEQALTAEKVNRTEKGAKTPRTSAAPTVTLTDRSAPKNPQAEPVTGVEADGSELDPNPLSNTNDVIDMGDEAVVSLNTRHYEYVDYFTSIKKAIELVWVYPEEGVLRGWSGKAKIRFSLDSQGRLLDVQLLGTSGHRPLDNEALMAIKVAGPFKPFPAKMNKKKLHIVGEFVYLPSYGAVH